MELFYLLKKEIKQPLRPLIIFVAISGIANAILIGIINEAAENASNAEINNQFFILFALGVAVVLISKKYVLDKSTAIVESVMHRLRNRMANKIRHTELNILEAVGASSIYTRLTQDATYISTVSANLISSVQSAITMVFTILYIGTISFWSFMLVIGVMSLGVFYYFRSIKSFHSGWKKISIKETAFVENVGNILNGFKEIKINRSKNEGVFYNFKLVNRDLKNDRVSLFHSYNKSLIFSQVVFYLLLGGILFMLPHLHEEHTEDVIKVTAAILFIIGPFEGLLTSMRYFDNANVSTRNITDLEFKLEELLKKNELDEKVNESLESFKLLPYNTNIEFKDLTYTYPATNGKERSFTVGPINLKFGKGELIFITGGNGSGKSTFLKLLTGLYPPDSGTIIMDTQAEDQSEIPVTPENYQQYRNLFTTIFTDFHLFDKLYGIDRIDPNVVNQHLMDLGLTKEKITYKNGSFTNLRLSTGQKKRLALATCILEDKPIYIFDEVAADLDPEFRDKYYYEILDDLKKQNKTVIVVSHDKHYWDIPDRLLEMQDGAIRELSRTEIDSLLELGKKAKR